KLSLLLTLSQTRPGATQVINAGLFQTIRDSGLFSVDPDLGICKSTATADPTSAALSKYYALLLAVIRVIAAVLVSRGPQNQQTIEQTKQFLAENRTLVVSLFKRQAGIGIGGASVSALGDDDSTMARVVEELVELFVLLMTRTEFIDVSKSTYFPFELVPLSFLSSLSR
ncbi:MAG: hypothetical protein L6R42_010621, partial [Xanthoria sp. 1 TBL-2021]